MYFKRALEEQILKASKNYPVVMVCGQRQVGKSTMLNHIKSSEMRYVSLDDQNARRLASEDVDLFFETYGYPLLIDEFQREPSILIKIKDIVDRLGYEGKDNKGLFWLTGSQKFKMMKNITESLAGRVAVFEMSGLSGDEIKGGSSDLFIPDIDILKSKKCNQESVQEVYETIFKGGMPRLYESEIDIENYYKNYINTYLERDVRGLDNIGKLSDFYKFLVFIAARISCELKYNEIASAIGISAVTAKAWVAILEKSGIIFLLHPFFSNISKRLIKSPKIYFMDSGLAAYLTRWPNAQTLSSGAMSGEFFENYVISEIVKNYYNNGKDTFNLSYYRDTDKKEIDLLLIEGQNIYPVEIKKNITPKDPDKNYSVLKKFEKSGFTIKPMVVVSLSKEFIPYNKNCYLCPVDLI